MCMGHDPRLPGIKKSRSRSQVSVYVVARLVRPLSSIKDSYSLVDDMHSDLVSVWSNWL